MEVSGLLEVQSLPDMGLGNQTGSAGLVANTSTTKVFQLLSQSISQKSACEATQQVKARAMSALQCKVNP